MKVCSLILLLTLRLLALSSDSTVILFNTKVKDSKKIALYYQEKRNIPSLNVIGLPMPTSKNISVQQYRHSILAPLREELTKRSLLEPSNQSIHFKVLTTIYGVPLKTMAPVKKDLSPREKSLQLVQTTGASVDSELTTLALLDSPVESSIPNPLYKRNNNKAVVKNKDSIVLVGRIDAPTFKTCIRMIDDAIQVESQGLSGLCYLDKALKKGGLQMGDSWLEEIAMQNMQQGIPSIVESSPALYPEGYPMTQIGLYYGWYGYHCSGALKTPQFNPGAIAVHIHSFSCRNLHSQESYWTGPLLERGACATLGNVHEPFLHLTTQLNRFHSYLLSGLSFVESSWRATPNLSWHNVVIGDPLYTPFKTAPKANDFAYLAKIAPLDKKSNFKKLLAKAANEKSSLLYEVAGLIQQDLKDHAKCLSYFRLAQSHAPNSAVKVRNILHQISYYRQHNQNDNALTLVTAHSLSYRNTPFYKALQSAKPVE